MNTKNRNLIELILQCAVAIFIFFPPFAFEETWNNWVLSGYNPESFVIVTLDEGCGMFWAILFLAALVAGIIFAVIQFTASDEKSNSKKVLILSVAEAVLYTIASIVCLTGQWFLGSLCFDFVPGLFFYIITVLITASVLITVIGYFNAKKSNVIGKNSFNQDGQKDKSLEDLEKLKELSERGVITQEEFDAKKKQILGL